MAWLTKHVTVGARVSITVIVAVQVSLPPRLSATVSVTVLVPNGYGPAGLRLKVIGSPSGSLEPLSTSAAVTVAWQFASADLFTFWQMAVGGRFAYTYAAPAFTPAASVWKGAPTTTVWPLMATE